MFPAPPITAPEIAPPVREQLLTVDDVAKWLRMSKAWVCRHSGPNAAEPVIPSLVCGVNRRYRASDIERFIERQTSPAAQTHPSAGPKAVTVLRRRSR